MEEEGVMDVWIIESGEYEQRHIDGVALSLEGAVAFIKARYGLPYIVRWEEAVPDGEDCSLVGHFSEVMGKSTRHDCSFDITKWSCAPEKANTNKHCPARGG